MAFRSVDSVEARITRGGKRVCESLHTTNRAEAELRLARLLADDPAPARPETFAEACGRLASGARLARLERHVLPACGAYALAALTRSDVRAVLAAMARAGMARSSCGQVLADMRAVCREASEGTPNPCDRIALPREAYVDRRERVRLTDSEFAAFVGRCDDAELVTLAVLSRCIGGLGTSDLLALR